MIRYLIWWWKTRKCDHILCSSIMIEFGMGKCIYCVKCGKVLKII